MTRASALENFFSAYRKNIIGHRQFFESPFGKKEIVYADWTASGRAYQPIEEYIQKEIMPFVANTHTETTITGTLMSKAYEAAKAIVKSLYNIFMFRKLQLSIIFCCGSIMQRYLLVQ